MIDSEKYRKGTVKENQTCCEIVLKLKPSNQSMVYLLHNALARQQLQRA